jgi:hypothetical protein
MAILVDLILFAFVWVLFGDLILAAYGIAAGFIVATVVIILKIIEAILMIPVRIVKKLVS